MKTKKEHNNHLPLIKKDDDLTIEQHKDLRKLLNRQIKAKQLPGQHF